MSISRSPSGVGSDVKGIRWVHVKAPAQIFKQKRERIAIGGLENGKTFMRIT